MLNFLDFEVFPRLWTVVIINPITREKTVIVNDPDKLKEHYQKHKNEIYVGFNSRNYDDWIFKAILCDFEPWDMNKWLIHKKRKGWEFSSLLKRIKLNSFDCMVGFNGLKTLEAFSGMDIRETTIPFDYAGEFTLEMIAEVLKYNEHDVLATIKVFMLRKTEFDSKVDLLKQFNLPISYIGKTQAQLAAIILGARRKYLDDEWNIRLPDTLVLNKYRHVADWFLNEENHDYDSKLETDICGVPHVIAWGGLHAAIPTCKITTDENSVIFDVDVDQLYPTLMVEYNLLSRAVSEPERFADVLEKSLLYKAQKKKKKREPYKRICNITYGAEGDRTNPMYDPLHRNLVCVYGQLLVIDLLEKIEDIIELLQSNTDGIFIKVKNENVDELKRRVSEWEKRTHLSMSYDAFATMYQKDVNNYIAIRKDGSYHVKGAYVKELSSLDYDLPIVNKAIKAYFIKGVPPERTVMDADKLIEFQKVVKLSPKYEWVEHEEQPKNKRFDQKAYRVFASTSPNDGRLLKCKMTEKGEKKDKFANTPDKCFIHNSSMDNLGVPPYLDRQYYIDLAWKRIKDFEGGK